MAGSIKFSDIFSKKRAVTQPEPKKVSAASEPQKSEASGSSVPQVRLVFMGTPKLSAELLQTLIETGYNIVAVVTKPDTKVGREQAMTSSSVKQLAESHGLKVLTPLKLNEEFKNELASLKPDLILVAAYGKILPVSILELPGLGCINVHYSLLPRFRGASPIQNALLFGDEKTGVTLQKMDAGLDTGDIIAAQELAIDPDDTTQTLTPKLNAVAQALLIKTLPLWIKQKIKAVPQKNEEAVLCQLIERADGKIEWANDAQSIYNRFRAFDPWPGIFTFWKKEDSFVRLKLIDVRLHTLPIDKHYQLGEVFQLADAVGVQTGGGVIILRTVQPEGKTKMAIEDFVRGNPDFIGSFLV